MRGKSDPKQFVQVVRGELDWIVMKALEKSRARRYDTAIGFAHDVECYLRAIRSRRARNRALYRLQKFARRNRGPVLAAGVVLLTLVGGILGTTFGLESSADARRQTENGSEILASVFRELDPIAADKEGWLCKDLLARRLGEAAQLLEGEAVGDPLIVARLQHPLGISAA